jgi:hypothetical protein
MFQSKLQFRLSVPCFNDDDKTSHVVEPATMLSPAMMITDKIMSTLMTPLIHLSDESSSSTASKKVPSSTASCPSEPALCPVLALYTYVSLAKKLVIAKCVDHESSIWLGTTSSTDGGVI